MTKTAVSVWDKCLSFIKDNIKPQAYKTWFDPIKPVKLSAEALTIQVPSKFFYEWLEEHYIKLLRVALVRELGKDAKLIYDVRMENTYSSNRPQIVKIPSSNRDPLKPQKIAVPVEVNKRELRNPFVIPGLQKVKIESQLNANYNFKNTILDTHIKPYKIIIKDDIKIGIFGLGIELYLASQGQMAAAIIEYIVF